MKKETKKCGCSQTSKTIEDNVCKGKEEGKMKVQPLADRVLVKPLEAQEKTKGGIILPDTAKEKPQQGKVVAVGKGRISEDGTIQPLEIKVSDIVLYGRYSGTEIKIDDQEYLIVKEDDILAILNG